eukprot:COSAG06_NODE_23494_length_679_cov_0.683587_1_plen_22_part_10
MGLCYSSMLYYRLCATVMGGGG